MSLYEVVYFLTGKTKPGHNVVPMLDDKPGCPDEADILSYLEARTSSRRRRQLDNHFANCDDCREALALSTQISDEPIESIVSATTPLTSEAIKKQTAKVLALIEQDENNRKQIAANATKPTARGYGFYISYQQIAVAAVVICAILAVVAYLRTRGHSPNEVATQAIVEIVKDGRFIAPRVSGNIPWSAHLATRGDGDNDQWQFNQALKELEFAKDESASADARLNLARIYLARGVEKDVRQALEILQGLAARGVESPEVLNDTGVALYQLGQYRQAIESFTNALEKRPDYEEALFNRALAERNANRYKEAKEDLERFIQTAQESKWKDEARSKLKSISSSQTP